MVDFLDVKRRFCPLSDEELADVERLAAEHKYNVPTSVGWGELLEHPRVVLLAEAGAGKTKEMERQAESLVAAGKFALFIPLERLAAHRLHDLLTPPETEALDEWRRQPDEPGWFLLDSLDELKLTSGTFDQALLHLANALHGHAGRARVIVSCRPSDWNIDVDLGKFRGQLPPPRADDSSGSREDFFHRALVGGTAVEESSGAEEQKPRRTSVLTVAMLGLDRDQIGALAGHAGVVDVQLFLAELRKKNAWDLARRPLDLFDLVDVWARFGELGSRALRFKENVAAKLRESRERPGLDILTDEKARDGAECLAFALAYAGRRTIRASTRPMDRVHDDTELDPRAVLPHWSEAERQALLRQALFDPATYGRVRFHTRPVQEFLAARYLKSLAAKGISRKALLRLLFADRHGYRIVRPSMREIAAWLALWDADVRREICRREPEILLSQGDPEGLSLGARADVLRAFVRAYGHGGQRWVRAPFTDLGTFAHPDLAGVISECWERGAVNDDVRELLIELIWLGPVQPCGHLALQAARDPACPPRERLNGIRALLACGDHDGAQACADSIVADPASWPDDVSHSAAAALFPTFLGVDDLLSLIRREGRTRSARHRFEAALWRIVDALDVLSSAANGLRDGLAKLIWETRASDCEPDRARGACSQLAPALALLCSRQLAADSGSVDGQLLRACVIGSRFGRGAFGRGDSVGKLKEQFERAPTRRRKVFWAELAFVEETGTDADSRLRFHYAQEGSLVERLGELDRPWLEEALSDGIRPDRQCAALHALIQLWHAGGRASAELESLRRAVQGDTALAAQLADRTAPPSPKAKRQRERFERKQKEREQKRKEGETAILADWTQWSDEVQADPDAAFAPDRQVGTLSSLYRLLQGHDRKGYRGGVWHRAAVVMAFDETVAERAERVLRDLWRETEPVLWSRRTVNAKRASVPSAWILGLMGLSAEATTGGWATRLAPEEARIATVYATIEMNGFAPFITDLLQAHASVVQEVLAGELRAEFAAGGDHAHLPTLSDLAYADPAVKRALMPHVIAGLGRWPAAPAAEDGERWASHLRDALLVLSEAQTPHERTAIARECARRYEAEPAGALSLYWLEGLFRADAIRGADLLIQSLSDGDPVSGERAIDVFAHLFGKRDPSLLPIAEPAERARVLGQLVRCAYAHVRREDDEVHHGVYEPQTRDNAETGRGFLVSALCDTPGAETSRVLSGLAAEALFASIGDRLRFLARQRAALDAETELRTPEDLTDLEDRLETPARDGDGLFAVLMDRLDDLDHDCRHADFSLRPLLRNANDESELQSGLASWLQDRANNVYAVAREEEVVGGRRTDIRLHVVQRGPKAVIEVKIVDNWTVSDLRTALRKQLAEGYLCHASCRHGCLLLAYHGRSRRSGSPRTCWIHPETRTRLDLDELAALLGEEARQIGQEHPEICVSVFLLDFSNGEGPAARGAIDGT